MTAPNPIVLMLHGVDPGDGRYEAAAVGRRAYVLPRDDFLRRLDAVAASGRKVLTPAEFDVEATDDAPSILLTFDDADRSHADVAAPALAERGLRAVFFAPANDVGREGNVDWPDVAAMQAAGMQIGTHGREHEFLTGLSEPACREALAAARRAFEERLGVSCLWASAPGGRFDARVLRAAREAGVERFFTSELAGSESREGLWTVGRVAVRAAWAVEDFAEFLKAPDAVWGAMRRRAALKRAARRLLGARLYAATHRFWWKGRVRRG